MGFKEQGRCGSTFSEFPAVAQKGSIERMDGCSRMKRLITKAYFVLGLECLAKVSEGASLAVVIQKG